MLTDFEALPAFCTMSIEFFPMGKVAGAGTDHSLPLCQFENPPPPPCACIGISLCDLCLYCKYHRKG